MPGFTSIVLSHVEFHVDCRAVAFNGHLLQFVRDERRFADLSLPIEHHVADLRVHCLSVGDHCEEPNDDSENCEERNGLP